MARFFSSFCAVCLFALMTSTVIAADVPERPYILWSKAEAAAIKERLDTDPAAQKQLERMLVKTKPGKRNVGGHPVLMNLFRYAVMGDEQAGERELKALLQFAGSVPEPLTEEFKKAAKDAKWVRGNASFSDRHMRDEQTLNVLRYDVLYDKLTPEQLEKVEGTFKAYIKFHVDGHRPWHPDFRYGRMTWLPNMHWPRTIGTHLMAVAMGDEELIKQMFESEGGWKYYFDEYVGDGKFYMEEFGKYYSNIGSMLMYCEGLERLGLNQYGYGYVGKGGATMKQYMEMYRAVGYPRTDIPGGMAQYPIVEMGDTPPKGMLGIVGLGGGDAIIGGYLPNGKGGDGWFGQSRMNGPLPKLARAMWWEMCHKQWPDEGYDYFLAQMRAPGEDMYYPSLFFGLEPIDPEKVTPPSVQSYVAMERGFAMLRAEESRDYWASEKPAVALQFGMYYVHYAHDCFSLLGYKAFNRPIYQQGWGGSGQAVVNDQIKSFPRGYIGGSPWADTVRGHAGGVSVDNLKPRPIASGERGLENHRIRQNLSDPAKFVAARVEPTDVKEVKWVLNEETGVMDVVEKVTHRGIFPGVDLERALVLTDEYLFDAFWLNSETERHYDWHVMGPGSLVEHAGQQWEPTKELYGSKLYRDINDPEMKQRFDEPHGYDHRDVKKMIPGTAAWTATILQDGPHGENSVLDKEWYDAKIGVHIHMLESGETTVYAGRPPYSLKPRRNKPVDAPYPETGGQTILVKRIAKQTMFAAIHEPYEGGPANSRIASVEKIVASDTVAAVKITGKDNTGINDRVFIQMGTTVDEPVTVEDGEDSFHFAGYAYMRIWPKKVEVVGDFHHFAVNVEGTPELFINGEQVKASYENGQLVYNRK